MITIRSIVIDIVFAMKGILDCVGYDFCCGMITGNHPPGSVNDRTGKGKSVDWILRWLIVFVLLVVAFRLYFIVHLFVGDMVVEEVF